jgi:hypothetical protein
MDLYSVAALLTATVKSSARRPRKKKNFAGRDAVLPEHVQRRRALVRDQERYVIRTVRTGLRHVDKYANIP